MKEVNLFIVPRFALSLSADRCRIKTHFTTQYDAAALLGISSVPQYIMPQLIGHHVCLFDNHLFASIATKRSATKHYLIE